MQKYLSRRNMYIRDPEIENNSWDVVGILYGMSNNNQYRPKYEKMLNKEIKDIIERKSNLMELDYFLKRKHDELEEESKEIKVEVSIGPMNVNRKHIRVPEAVLVKCKSAHYMIVNRILQKMANVNYLGDT